MRRLIVFSVIAVLLSSGCVGDSGQTAKVERIKGECIQACEKALENDRNLSKGPCLLDPMEDGNWVCDVAHDPRQPGDNKRKNQCDAWHRGTAENFVEVTPDCEFIRRG